MHGQTEYFVGLGTLSLINASLAQAKGRSGLAWWFFSLFLGPLATLLIVILPSETRVPTSSQTHEPLPATTAAWPT